MIRKKFLVLALVATLALAGCTSADTTSETTTEQESTTQRRTKKEITTKQPKTTQTTEETTTEETLIDVAAEKVFSYEGTGDDVIPDIYINDLVYVHYYHDDDGYTSVKAHHDDTYELLVSDTDGYVGDTLLLPFDSNVTFEIVASGDWKLEIYEIGASSTDTFTGVTDYVTPIFICSSSTYKIEYFGEGYFSVKGYYDNLDYDLLVNETDKYSGKVFFNQKNNYAFFEIKADDVWTISPVK